MAQFDPVTQSASYGVKGFLDTDASRREAGVRRHAIDVEAQQGDKRAAQQAQQFEETRTDEAQKFRSMQDEQTRQFDVTSGQEGQRIQQAGSYQIAQEKHMQFLEKQAQIAMAASNAARDRELSMLEANAEFSPEEEAALQEEKQAEMEANLKVMAAQGAEQALQGGLENKNNLLNDRIEALKSSMTANAASAASLGHEVVPQVLRRFNSNPAFQKALERAGADTVEGSDLPPGFFWAEGSTLSGVADALAVELGAKLSTQFKDVPDVNVGGLVTNLAKLVFKSTMFAPTRDELTKRADEAQKIMSQLESAGVDAYALQSAFKGAVHNLANLSTSLAAAALQPEGQRGALLGGTGGESQEKLVPGLSRLLKPLALNAEKSMNFLMPDSRVSTPAQLDALKNFWDYHKLSQSGGDPAKLEAAELKAAKSMAVVLLRQYAPTEELRRYNTSMEELKGARARKEAADTKVAEVSTRGKKVLGGKAVEAAKKERDSILKAQKTAFNPMGGGDEQ